MLEFNAHAFTIIQYCIIYIIWRLALLFIPRGEHSRPRPKAEGQCQGKRIPRPRPRNLALRPRINILGRHYRRVASRLREHWREYLEIPLSSHILSNIMFNPAQVTPAIFVLVLLSFDLPSLCHSFLVHVNCLSSTQLHLPREICAVNLIFT